MEFDLEKVRQRMSELGTSQSAMAKAIGMNRSSLNRALAGHRRFSAEERLAIVGYFDGRVQETERYLVDTADKGFRRSEAFRRVVARRRVSTKDIAVSTGIDELYLEDYMLGMAMPDDDAAVLSKALGADLDDPASMTGTGRPDIEPDHIAIYAPPDRRSTGKYSGKPGVSSYSLQKVETRPAPAPLVGVLNAYGIYAPDHGWNPRFLPGDLVFFHPFKGARLGQFALVAWDEQLMAVGEVVDLTPAHIVLKVGGTELIEIAQGRLIQFHRAVGAWFE